MQPGERFDEGTTGSFRIARLGHHAVVVFTSVDKRTMCQGGFLKLHHDQIDMWVPTTRKPYVVVNGKRPRARWRHRGSVEGTTECSRRVGIHVGDVRISFMV